MDNLFCGNPLPPLPNGGGGSRWFVQRRFVNSYQSNIPGMPISIPGPAQK